MTLRGSGLGKALAVAAAALLADQLSKIFVRNRIEFGERIDLVLGIDLVRVSNEGIAFGLLDGSGSWVILLAAVAFAILMGYFLAVADRPGLWLPLGLLAGGALGNLTDRIAEGAVTDFIDPPNWPAFNVADIEITAGVLLIILMLLRDDGAEDDVDASAREGDGDADEDEAAAAELDASDQPGPAETETGARRPPAPAPEEPRS